MLKELLADEAAVLYNWCGKQFKDRVNKFPIKDTVIPGIVFSKFNHFLFYYLFYYFIIKFKWFVEETIIIIWPADAVEMIRGEADGKEVEEIMKIWLRNSNSRLQRK